MSSRETFEAQVEHLGKYSLFFIIIIFYAKMRLYPSVEYEATAISYQLSNAYR